MGKKKKGSTLAKKMMKMGIGDFSYMGNVQEIPEEQIQEIGVDVDGTVEELLEKEDTSSGSEIRFLTSKEGTGVFKVPIEMIDPPKFHDRVYVSPASVMRLADSLKKHGQAQPVLLRLKEDGRYERIAGYLRIEAAKLLGWDSVYAFIVDVDDVTAFKLMVAENKIETALYAIELFTGLSPEEVKKFFYLITNKETGRNKQPITEEELRLKQKIIEVLEELNISGWETFGNMLKLYSSIHPKVKELMIKNGWRYFVAYELNKTAKNPELFEQVLKLIEEITPDRDGKVSLSISEMRSLIAKARKLLNEENSEIFP